MSHTFRGSPASDTGAYASRTDHATVGPGRMSLTRWPQKLMLAAAFAGCTVVGMGIGQYVASRRAHVAGACVALDMAEAHGAIDEPRRKRIIQSLTSVTNPLVDRFFVTRSEMLRACSELRTVRLRDS